MAGGGPSKGGQTIKKKTKKSTAKGKLNAREPGHTDVKLPEERGRKRRGREGGII